MSFLSGVSSVFSKLGKSEAFTGTLAAIGTAAAGAIVTKITGVPSAAQQAYAKEQAAAPAAAAAKAAAAVPLLQQIPWTPVLLIAAVGVLGFVLMKMHGKGRGG